MKILNILATIIFVNIFCFSHEPIKANSKLFLSNEKDLLFEPQDDSGLKNLSAIAEQISDVNNIVITIEKIEGVYVIFLTSSTDEVDEDIRYIVNQENNNLFDLNNALKVENLTNNDYEEICKR